MFRPSETLQGLLSCLVVGLSDVIARRGMLEIHVRSAYHLTFKPFHSEDVFSYAWLDEVAHRLTSCLHVHSLRSRKQCVLDTASGCVSDGNFGGCDIHADIPLPIGRPDALQNDDIPLDE